MDNQNDRQNHLLSGGFGYFGGGVNNSHWKFFSPTVVLVMIFFYVVLVMIFFYYDAYEKYIPSNPIKKTISDMKQRKCERFNSFSIGDQIKIDGSYRVGTVIDKQKNSIKIKWNDGVQDSDGFFGNSGWYDMWLVEKQK